MNAGHSLVHQHHLIVLHSAYLGVTADCVTVASRDLSHSEELLGVLYALSATTMIPSAAVVMFGLIRDDELAGGELDHGMPEGHWTRSACIGYGLFAVVLIAFVVIAVVLLRTDGFSAV